VRRLRPFCRARDDVDFRREFINLREPRAVRACVAEDFRDLVVFARLARNRRPPVFRDLVSAFLTGRSLSAPFETAVASLTAFRIGRRPRAAAFPATAPITPPTTAPVGPAMLPIAAPVTAPAVCFGIGGIWISSDDVGLFFFSDFGWSGINDRVLSIFVRYKLKSDDKVDIALKHSEMPSDAHQRSTRVIASEKHCQLFGTNNERPNVPCVSSTPVLVSGSYQQSRPSKTDRAILGRLQ
jgi:hypothetical protein